MSLLDVLLPLRVLVSGVLQEAVLPATRIKFLDLVPGFGVTATPSVDGDTLTVELAASGGGASASGFRMSFSATTTDSDPGAGTFRFDNATIASITKLYIDLTVYGGENIADWLATIDDSFGTTKGYLWFRSVSDSTRWAQFRVTARTGASGYDKFDIAVVDYGSGGLPTTTAGDTLISFDALGRLDAVALASQVSGTLLIANGGTGLTAVGSAYQNIRVNAGATAIEYFAPGQLPPRVTESTTARTVGLSDAGKVIDCTHASGCSVTIPANATTAFPIETCIMFEQSGAAQVTIVAAGGVTINTSETLLSKKLHAMMCLIKKGTNEWTLTGEREAA